MDSISSSNSNLSEEEKNWLLKMYCRPNIDEENELIFGPLKKDYTFNRDSEIGIQNISLQRLEERKLLIFPRIHKGNMFTISDMGKRFCANLINQKIRKQKAHFVEKMETFPDRAISCIVNRIFLKRQQKYNIYDHLTIEENFDSSKPFFDIYEDSFGQNIILPKNIRSFNDFREVLLIDKRMKKLFDAFQDHLKSSGLLIKINNQYWCPPEVLDFLSYHYENKNNLNWKQEKSLGFFYFFWAYEKRFNQLEKSLNLQLGNLMVFDSESEPLFDMVSKLGITKNEIFSIFNDMKYNSIVDKLESSILILGEEMLFEIKNHGKYFEFIKSEFLMPVVDSLLETKMEKLLNSEESDILEFKSSLYWDFRQKKVNKNLKKEILRVIVSFLNNKKKEKKLLLGVADDKTILGIERDLQEWGHGSRDLFEQTLSNLICDYIGPQFHDYIDIEYVEKDGKTICEITVRFSSKQPAYLKGKNGFEFWLKVKNRKKLLDSKEVVEYVTKTWNVST